MHRIQWLRSTISRHLLPPISWWGTTVDSYRRSDRNSRTSHRKAGLYSTGRPIPLRENGGEGDTEWWPRFDACLILPETTLTEVLSECFCRGLKAPHLSVPCGSCDATRRREIRIVEDTPPLVHRAKLCHCKAWEYYHYTKGLPNRTLLFSNCHCSQNHYRLLFFFVGQNFWLELPLPLPHFILGN